MNGLFDGLPWNLSALGALVVLAVGMVTELDPWVALERAVIAFVSFLVVGLIGRQAFGGSPSHSNQSAKPSRTASKDP